MPPRILSGFRRPLCVLLVLGVTAGPLAAQDPEVEALKARLVELEKQQEKLLQRLDQLAPPPAQPAGGQPQPGAARDPGPGATKKEDPKQEGPKKEEPKKDEPKTWVVGEQLGMPVRWDNGQVGETEDKAFRVHVGGRLQADAGWFSTSDRVQFGPGGIGRVDDAVGFRRARLDVEGTMWEVCDFLVQLDFVNTFNVNPDGDPLPIGVPAPTDLWMTFTHLPVVGNIRVGQQKPPISFEHLVSSRFLDFVERSLGFETFVEAQDNGFRPGVQAFNWVLDERASWALGVFKYTRSFFGFNRGDGEYEVVGRLTGLPVYEADGEFLVHLGLGASYADLDDGQERFRARLLVRNGPGALHNILADALMLGDSRILVVPEFAMVLGPLTVQAEYYGAWVTDAVAPVNPPEARRPRGTFFGQAFYVQALWFLTGEHRRYNRATSGDRRRVAVFDRVIPIENAFAVDSEQGLVCGRGGWQVGVRYSYLDLADKDINGPSVNGAVVHDMTLGLNWFLNPNTKLQWNYSLAYRDANGGQSNGFIHAFGTRLAFDF